MDGEPTERESEGSVGSRFGHRERTLLGVGIVAGVLLFVAFRLDWQAVARALGRADLGYVAVGAAAAVFAVAAWSEGLRGVLPPSAEPVTRRRGFLVFASGMLVRYVVPVGYASSIAVIGYVYRREAGLSLDRSLAAVSVAEVGNAIASTGVAVTGVLLLAFLRPTTPYLPWLLGGAAVVVIGGSAAAVLLWYRLEAVQRVAHAGASLLAGVADRLADRDAGPLAPASIEAAIGSYYRSLSTVSSQRRAVARAIGFAALAWLGFATSLYVCGRAVGIEIPFPLALILVTVGGYATVLPVPGGLGGYELGVAGGVTLLTGIGVVPALAATLLFRLCSYWLVIVVGLLAALVLSIDVRRLIASAVGPERADAGPPDR